MVAKGKQRRLKAEFGKFRENPKMKKHREMDDDEEKDEDDNSEQTEEFTLDDVLRLGGTKADYIMLAGVNEEAELMDGGKKTVIDDLAEGELQDFITKLGISKYSDLQVFQGDDEEEEEEKEENQTSEDKDKRKEMTQEESSEANTTTTTAATEEEPKSDEKKKKKKKKKDADGGRKSKKKNSCVFELVTRQVLLLKPGGKWHDVEYTAETSDSVQDEILVGQYKELAQKLLEAETNLYKNKKNLQKGANTSWMKNIVSTGTLADRMAAMTVLIQDAPVHSLEHVENLVALVKKTGGRKQGLIALDTLKELLLSDLLPENRKLRPFPQRPFDELEERCSGNRDVRDRRLVLWYFEHRLKQLVGEFVTALGVLAHDSVMVTKTKTLRVIHEMLCNCPEQEKTLLSLLVNKLGDPDYKVASKASYLLETLLYRHPVMKTVVCCEVERLMFRPNVGSKAQYYAACFLNQVTLSEDESELASKLITIYFTFFHLCVKKKDVESKMLGALLTGVNRAYPYAKSGDEKVIEQMDTLFKVVHLVKFSTAIQALMLLFQVMNSQQTVSDRYYVALYRKLLDPGLSVNSRQNMFLNLLYKSLKADVVLRRIKAFVKRLLQVSCEQNPAFTCGALFLISEVMKAKPGLRLLLQKEADGEEEAFQDLKNDESEEEEERFVDADKLEEAGDKTTQSKPAASWIHHQNLQGGKNSEAYDPTHRNPLYCGANHSTLWELHQLSQHYHPSVALFAKTLLQGDSVQYTGDPLQDFTLIRFLHRFVFRNPKKIKGKQNTESTVMQPKHRQSANTINSLPVNCPEYLSREEHQIPVDEVFFYRFFKKREGEKQLKMRRGGDDESVDDVDDDEFEKVLDSFESDSYFTEFKEDELDFAGNVKPKSQKGKADEASDSELDSDEDLDDEEVSLGSLTEEDFGDELEEDGGVFMDPDEDDEEAAEMDEDEDPDDAAPVSSGIGKKKRKSHDLDFSESLKLKSTKKQKKRKLDDRVVFAAAEEFGELLDSNAGSKFDNIGMNAMSNRDNASVKQLKWEAKRDDWVKGRDVQTLRRKKSMFKKRKTLGKSSGAKRVNRKK